MSRAFERFAGVSAVVVAIVTFVYSIAFAAALRTLPRTADIVAAVVNTFGGILSVAVFVALYGRLRRTDEGFALLGVLFGVVAGLGSAVHAMYDLARFIEPPGRFPALPSESDPRGFLTFAMTGAAIALFSYLMSRGEGFPKAAGSGGYVLAVLLAGIFLARLIIVDIDSPVILTITFITGLIIYPWWFLTIGRSLSRGS